MESKREEIFSKRGGKVSRCGKRVFVRGKGDVTVRPLVKEPISGEGKKHLAQEAKGIPRKRGSNPVDHRPKSLAQTVAVPGNETTPLKARKKEEESS